jgi:hypothetical protein
MVTGAVEAAIRKWLESNTDELLGRIAPRWRGAYRSPTSRREALMPGEVVPLGKYKGQPVEVMASDTDYCEWLAAQPWFSAKYRNIYVA